MQEYVTEALVLHKKPFKEHDRLVDLYTKQLGRVEARLIGGQKILSKMNMHLNVLNIVSVRLVEKNVFTITDVMPRKLWKKRSSNVFARALEFIFLIRSLTPHTISDIRLWHEITKSISEEKSSFHTILKLFGYYEKGVRCSSCGFKNVASFGIYDHIFFCDSCAVRLPSSYVTVSLT